MNRFFSLGGILLCMVAAAACSGVTSDSVPRATRAPDVRCMTPPPAGSPGEDRNAQPMFFLFCMQSP